MSRTPYTRELEIPITDQDYAIADVTFLHYPAERATWGYSGGEPGEPEYIEVLEVRIDGGPLMLLREFTPAQREAIEEACLSALKAN